VSERRRVIFLSVLGMVGALLAIITIFKELPAPVRAILILLCSATVAVFIALLRPTIKSRLKPIAAAFLATAGLLTGITVAKSDNGTPKAKLPSCNDVSNSSFGVKDTTYYAAFRDAYSHAGERQALGCPRNNDTSGYVHKWGEGYSQDLQGLNGHPARLMVLPPSGPVIVLKDTLNRDYTKQFGPNSAPQLGYPTANPQQCGRARIVPLARGVWAPGAMVTSPNPEEWIWLARPFWQLYRKLGGPLGPLGLPVGQADLTAVEPVQPFEHGSLRLDPGKRTARTDRKLAPVRPLPKCPAAIK
jgi:hypothetical protein